MQGRHQGNPNDVALQTVFILLCFVFHLMLPEAKAFLREAFQFQEHSLNVFSRLWPKPAHGLISGRKQPRPCFMDISVIKSRVPGPLI